MVPPLVGPVAAKDARSTPILSPLGLRYGYQALPPYTSSTMRNCRQEVDQCYRRPMDTPVVELSPTQRTVLMTLKRLGEATADELAAKLDVSPSAVRQHLNALRAAELVTSRRQRGHPGRPADLYVATDQAERVFVDNDARLSIEILELVEENDPDLVARIFDRRSDRMVRSARERLAGKPIDGRIDVVAQLLDEQGFMADFEKVDDQHYRINLHSCAIWAVASRYRQACHAELALIRDLLPDAVIERVTHKTAGAHTCAYDIRLVE